MNIFYTAIGQDDKIFAQNDTSPGVHELIARRLVENIPHEVHRKSYVHDDFLFHYIAEADGLTIICVSDKHANYRLLFEYMADVLSRFLTQFGERYKSATDLEYQEAFSNTMQERMEHYCHHSEPKFGEVSMQIRNAANEVFDEIEKTLDTGEELDRSHHKTQGVEDDLDEFESRSGTTKLRLYFKEKKISCCFCLFTLFIVAIVFGIAYFVFGPRGGN